MESLLLTGYHAILQAIAAPVLVCDSGGKICFVNKAAEKVFDFPMADLVNTSISALLPHHPGGLGQKKDGSQFPVSVSISHLSIQDRVHFVATVTDTTAVKDAKDALDEFSYSVSHDLRQQTRNIGNYVELLHKYKDSNTPEEAAQYLAVINLSAAMLNELIEALLLFSRAGNSNSIEPCDCNEIVRGILYQMRERTETSKAVITMGELPLLDTDKTSITEIFRQLVFNALVFTRKNIHPIISITSVKKPGYWEFEVKDNGIGIAEKYYSKIFGIFQRLHAEETYPGIGAGLAICRKLVERLGGKIYLQSVLDTGSSFYFTVPENDLEPMNES